MPSVKIALFGPGTVGAQALPDGRFDTADEFEALEHRKRRRDGAGRRRFGKRLTQGRLGETDDQLGGDKLAAEQRDYERLLSAGIPMPRLLDVDTENERILKEYIPGPTVAELIAENRLPGFCLRQLKAMCARLYPVHLNIDYYPTNFVLSVDRLYYVDYECNDYSPKWDFEHWGAQYWTGQE